jgi:hypothetical protein
MSDLKRIIDILSKLTVVEAATLAEMLKQKWSSEPASALFEQRARTRQEPLRRGESLFEFFDSCGRGGYDDFRSIVNGWLEKLPAASRNELISRMRYGGDREFGACLVELSVQSFICGSGYDVRVHPEVPGSAKRPDFAVVDKAGGAAHVYVEVTTVNPAATQEAEINRENAVYNAIDGVKLPAGTILGYRLVCAQKNSPPLRRLVADVERWAQENAEAAKTKDVSQTFTVGGWIVELDLYGGGSNPESATQAIGVAQMRGGMIAPHKDLRNALIGKSRRYGTLDEPFLIAVADAKEQLYDKEAVKLALTEAVLGNEIVQYVNDVASITYARNGFWRGPNAPRNRHVSGVLLLPETGLWRLREEEFQPVLAVNPWAEQPLPATLRIMHRFEADDGRWKFYEGKRFADIVGLPDPWPPAEIE